MALINQGGKLLLRDGKLGTGQGCCCGQCNPSTCPTGTECTPPCVCVNGQCVQGGACCLPDGTCTSGGTQEDCEACETVNTCTEYLFLEDPEAACPEGWTADGWGGCTRTTNPPSCDECQGWCDSQQTGTCGEWKADATCETALCECMGMEDEEQLIVESITSVNCDANGQAAARDFLESQGWSQVTSRMSAFGTLDFYGRCCGMWQNTSVMLACGTSGPRQFYRVCPNPLPEWFNGNPLP